MDKTLIWEGHIQRVTDRCFGVLIGLAYAKHVLPHEVLSRLVDALMMFHVRYCAQYMAPQDLLHSSKFRKKTTLRLESYEIVENLITY